MFAAGKMTHRPMPMPLMVRFGSGGHEGATVVGKVSRIFDGPGGYWGEGEFLDPVMVPEVPKAIYMLKEKVMGPSVDLDRDFTVEAVRHPTRQDKRAGMFREYNVIGVTLVPMPAFHQVHMAIDNDENTPEAQVKGPDVQLGVDSEADRALLASIGVDASDWPYFDVNGETWKQWPLAPRDYQYDADDAVKRIAYWSGIGSENPNVDRYASAFLWRNGNQTGDSLAQDSFRLPLCDIINNEPHLIYHAVYSAAALLSGAHGGLPNIPEEDKQAMIPVINELYSVMAQAFGDENLVSPFMEKVRQEASIDTSEDCGCSDMPDVTINIGDGVPMNIPAYTTNTTNGTLTLTHGFATDKTPYGDVKYADPGYQDDGIKRYPLDSEEHCRAAWSYINMPKNAAKYSPEELKNIKGRIKEALKKYGVQVAEDEAGSGQMSVAVESVDQGAVLASVAPLQPPTEWFTNPKLKAPTRLTIDEDGHIFGHLAQWKVCHVGIGKSCVMAPKSRTAYGLFRIGQVRTDDGSLVDIGKITLGTGHADATWGVMPSREHYDNTGWAAAVVNIGEDQHGIWVNGSLTTTMTPERIAELRASALSGDWRYVNGNLELIAALAVNTPGFPIYREQSGHAFSLMAVGVVGQEEEKDVNMETEFSATEPETPEVPADDQVEDAGELAARIARLAEIDNDLAEHNRTRRMAQLAAIDQERASLQDRKVPAGAVSPTSEEDAIFIQYNARFQALAEE
jgi:hypothetical protein